MEDEEVGRTVGHDWPNSGGEGRRLLLLIFYKNHDASKSKSSSGGKATSLEWDGRINHWERKKATSLHTVADPLPYLQGSCFSYKNYT